MQGHVADHSGGHYRRQLLVRLMQESSLKVEDGFCDVCRHWTEEMRLAEELLFSYPEHESLWLHFRFLHVWYRVLLRWHAQCRWPEDLPNAERFFDCLLLETTKLDCSERSAADKHIASFRRYFGREFPH